MVGWRDRAIPVQQPPAASTGSWRDRATPVSTPEQPPEVPFPEDVPPPEQGAMYQRSNLQQLGHTAGVLGESAARGITGAVLGLPDLALTAAAMPINAMSGRPIMEGAMPLQSYAYETADKAREKLGIPDVQPETGFEKATANPVEFMTGAVGGGKLANTGLKMLGDVAPNSMTQKSIADALIKDEAAKRGADIAAKGGAMNVIKGNVEAAKPTIATAMQGAGAGAGYDVAQDIAPDSPVAGIAGALVGGAVTPSAAKLATQPVSVPKNFIQNNRYEKFGGEWEKKKNIDKAAKAYQGATFDKEDAIKNLEQGIADSAGDKVKNTSAQMSRDPGLLGEEKLARNTGGDISSEFMVRDKAIADENAQIFEKLAPAERGNTQVAADEITGQVQKVRDEQSAKLQEKESALTDAQLRGQDITGQAEVYKEKNIAGAESELDAASASKEAQALKNQQTAQEIATAPKMTQEEAGKSMVADVLEPKKKALEGEYGKMIAPFEANRTKTIPTESAVPSIKEAEVILEQNGEYISPFRDPIKNIAKEMQDRQSPADLVALRRRLNDLMRSANKADNGAAAKAINHLRDGLESVVDVAGFSDDFKAAGKFYKENIAEPFKQSNSGDVLAAGKRGEVYNQSPAESIKTYFKAGAGGGDSMQQLIDAGGSDVNKLVREHVVGDVIDSLYDKSKDSISKQGIRKYITNHKEALAKVPEIQQELEDFIRQIDTGDKLLGEASMGVKSAKENLRGTKVKEVEKLKNREVKVSTIVSRFKEEVGKAKKETAANITKEERSAAKFFLKNDDVDGAISKVFSDTGNLTKNLKELRERVEKDTSGKALNGLKEAIYDHFEKKVINNNKQAPVSGNKLENIEKNFQDSMVKAGLWGDDEVKALETVRRRINAASLTSDFKAAPKTTEVSFLQNRRVKAVVRSLFRGLSENAMQGGTRYSIFNDAVSLYGGKTELVEDLIQRVRLDPELAKLQLKRDLTKYEESVYRTKLNYIFSQRNTRIMEKAQDDEAENDAEKPTEKPIEK